MEPIGASQREADDGAMPPLPGFHQLVGASAAMQALFRAIETVAGIPVPVLILGETGTGKELVAHALYQRSPRHHALYQTLNCGAFARDLLPSQLFGHRRGAFTGAAEPQTGLLVAAQGGTVFLDEIGDLPLEAQAMLLRFLEQGEVQPLGAPRPVRVDTRVLAATHRDLAAWIRDGRFREDLYERLAWEVLEVPPLRARLDDLPLLVEHFRRHYNRKFGLAVEGLTPAALDRLASRSWPRNVRELGNVLGRTMTRTRRGGIGPDDLRFGPASLRPDAWPGAREVGRASLAPVGADATAAPPAPPPDRHAVALACAAREGAVTRRALTAACGISTELARQTLVALVADGRLRRVGDGRQTRYIRP